jgi:hypothetical protein
MGIVWFVDATNDKRLERGSVFAALCDLVHQIARLEGHGHTFSLAVMTDGDPTMGYGIDTIQGTTRALL